MRSCFRFLPCCILAFLLCRSCMLQPWLCTPKILSGADFRGSCGAWQSGLLTYVAMRTGFQHEFCAAHLRDSEGGGGGVCGGGWLSALPAALWRVGGGGGGVRLVAFKPGAGRLAQPHKCVQQQPAFEAKC